MACQPPRGQEQQRRVDEVQMPPAVVHHRMRRHDEERRRARQAQEDQVLHLALVLPQPHVPAREPGERGDGTDEAERHIRQGRGDGDPHGHVVPREIVGHDAAAHVAHALREALEGRHVAHGAREPADGVLPQPREQQHHEQRAHAEEECRERGLVTVGAPALDRLDEAEAERHRHQQDGGHPDIDGHRGRQRVQRCGADPRPGDEGEHGVGGHREAGHEHDVLRVVERLGEEPWRQHQHRRGAQAQPPVVEPPRGHPVHGEHPGQEDQIGQQVPHQVDVARVRQPEQQFHRHGGRLEGDAVVAVVEGRQRAVGQ